MNPLAKSTPADELIGDDDVVAYLRNHPDFFYRHQPLLSILRLPHPSGSAVSLVERQVSVLREQNRALESKLMELVNVARDNEQLGQQIHRLGLELLHCQDLNDVLATVHDHAQAYFSADALSVVLIGDEENHHQRHPDDEHWALFDEVFERGVARCGRAQEAQLAFLYDRPELYASSALIPLIDGQRLGILALASESDQRFHPGMGTHFLNSMGELLAGAVRRHRA